MGSRILCVIPARKGSKRLPDKTIRLFKGRPLIEWTIDQAKQLFRKEQIIINTDYDFKRDDCIVYERPADLCGDDVTTEAVLRNMLLDYPECEIIVLLQLTSPNRKIDVIKQTIKVAYSLRKNARSSFNQSPDGQCYVWWTNTKWEFINIESNYIVDIDTQLDFEVAEALHDL